MEIQAKIYFNEPRLKMTLLGRFLVKLISYVTYALVITGATVFILSDIIQLRWLGILLLLFLADRLVHIRQAEESINKRVILKLFNPKVTLNVAKFLTPAARNVLISIYDRAKFLSVNPYLILLEKLATRSEIKEALTRIDIPLEEFWAMISQRIKESEKNKLAKTEIYKLIEELTKQAFLKALQSKGYFVGIKFLFTALFYIESEEIKKLFSIFNLEAGDLESALVFSKYRHGFTQLRWLPATLGGFFARRPRRVAHRIMNRAWTARPTPILDSFSIDFTDLARLEKVGFLIGHQQEFDHLLDILSRPVKQNVLLVGEPGTGKETLVAHLAFLITKDEVPPNLFDKRLVALSVGNLVAGVQATGELQSRVNKIIEEITIANNIILYIPDIHNLTKTSGESFLSAADILIPIITQGLCPVIGATYPKEFRNLIETQTDFVNAFEIIRVQEISEQEAVRIMVYDSLILERQYNILISFGAIKQAVKIAHRYFHQKPLPSGAQDFLREALADVKGKNEKVLTPEAVTLIAERKLKVPIRQAVGSEVQQLLNLEEIIHRKLINQNEAVKAVSRAFREYRSGLSRREGPIASFLFIGPTGVGKTELSKILTAIQFGNKEAMIRFDMSEYQDKQNFFRFIGSPDGRISGQLTEAVKIKPYSLILLDEFEKAHPDILNLFLQVFDEGRLTDNLGNTIDFTNTIIIATSNAHSDFIKSEIEQGHSIEEISVELKKKLSDYFRPELLNRFTDVIVFRNLSPQDIRAIAELQLNELSQFLEENQGISLEFEDSVISKIAELGYDPVFGARPLRKTISESLRSPLADKILKQEIGRGNKLKVKFEQEKFEFIPVS